ncbi:YadA-like family protein [Dyella silvae]|uniref:YadA-like family protein n=1 Tax=Dyella silvae TaxID=2994424 RepID=UPI002263B999|nr:ESPR-type extended signal peptide-containing protein [Dyella silvae]
MNAVYRIVWNTTQRTWVVASEFAKGHKKQSKRRNMALASLAASVAFLAGGLLTANEAHAEGPGNATGACTTASTEGSVAVGGNDASKCTTASGASSVAMGELSQAVGAHSVAMGYNAVAGDTQGIAIGDNARTMQAPWGLSGNIAMGTNALNHGNNAVVIGTNASSGTESNWNSWGGSVTIGSGAHTENGAQMALGGNSYATTTGAIAMGFGAEASGWFSTAIQTGATASGANAVAIGTSAKAAADAVAIGGNSDPNDPWTTGANAQGARSVALGARANATVDDSVAIGSGAVAKAAQATTGGEIAGNHYDYAGAAPMGTVSVGDVGAERTITNVAAGRVNAGSTDAVNGSQLHATNLAVENLDKASAKYDVNADGSINYNSMTLAGATYDSASKSGGTRIKNVARGIDDGDAVNVQQLKDVGLIDSSGNSMDAVVYDPGSNRASVTLGGVNASAPVVLRNVAAGVAETDAVNVSQLNQLKGQVNNIDARVTTMENGAGGTAQAPRPESAAAIEQTPVTPANTASTAQLQGVTSALGGGSTIDASGNVTAPNYNVAGSSYNNVGDALHGLDTKLDDNFNKLNSSISKVNRQANRGIAAASAVQSVTPYIPGKVAINAGVAGYRGEAALGVGISRWNNSGKVNFNAGVSTARGDVPVFRVGVGMVLGE